MSKSKSHLLTKTNKSPIEILIAKYGLWSTIITAILSLVGVGITGYLSYAGIRLQVESPIIATQTAQAYQLMLLPNGSTSVYTNTSTPPKLISITATPTYSPLPKEYIKTSPLDILSLLVGQSDTDYRFEITIKNTNSYDDRTISHIDIEKGYNIKCNLGPEEFKVSDKLIVQQISNSTFSAQGDVTNNLDSSFNYAVNGVIELGGCDELSFTFGFDTSILIPKDSTIQFYILLPRKFKNIENIYGTPPPQEITSRLTISNNKDNSFEKNSYIKVSVWDAEAIDPIIVSKQNK